jgi:superfamily II DNA/RNA helicase
MALVGSTFAALGAADVVLRAAIKTYSILCDIATAPDELKRLNERVDKGFMLMKVSKECLQELSKDLQMVAADMIIGSLVTTQRAYYHELQNLSRLAAKHNSHKTCSGIKFVVEKREIDKTSKNLEQIESKLAIILALAYRLVEISYLCRESCSAYHKWREKTVV